MFVDLVEQHSIDLGGICAARGRGESRYVRDCAAGEGAGGGDGGGGSD